MAGISFRKGCESQQLYGDFITVVFEYSQDEREAWDQVSREGEQGPTSGYVKAKELFGLYCVESILLTAV